MTDRSLLREAPAVLAAKVRSGELAAAELAAVSLAAIEADDPTLGCFIAVDGDRALDEARAVDALVAAGKDPGPLAGVPLAVKDNEDAIGYTTTVGSAWRRGDPPAERDSVLVAKLRAAGCVVIGKTNLPELAWKGDSVNAWGGATANPWNLERTAGGSSGGSAAAVAAGLVPLATASDGGGSIRIPAAVCGLTGFKPSLGRIASGGPNPPGWPELSTKGLLTRHIADSVDALDVVVGPDPTDIRSLPKPDSPWRNALQDIGAPMRVAWSPTMGFADVDAEVLAICEKAVGVLAAQGAEVEEVPVVWEDDPIWDWLAIVASGNARTLAGLRGRPEWDLVDPGLRGVADYGATRTGEDVLRGIDAAHRRNLALVEVFHRASILLCPTVSGQTALLGGQGLVNGERTDNWIQLTYGFNLTRSPAGTVCAGFTADGMPVGLQVVGPQHADVAVLRCLLLLEQALGLDTVPPNHR